MVQARDPQAALTGLAPPPALVSRAAAQGLLDRLAERDSLAVVQAITAWLDVSATAEVSLQARFEAVDLLDCHARHHQFNLVPEYLDTPRMRKLVESELWSASHEFWRVVGDAYLRCLEGFQAAGAGVKDFRERLPLVVCRILRALAIQLKWTLLRYAHVEERLWRDLGRVYLFAGNWEFATHAVRLYPGGHDRTSAQEELLKALMLQMSVPNALTPVQQHIAERIIAHCGARFVMRATRDPACPYAFDLSMHRPPARARRNAAPRPLLRFFGPGVARDRLDELLADLRRQRRAPPELRLGGHAPQEVESVLQHLARCWSDTPPARRGWRRETLARLTVVPGLAESVRWLDGETGALASESWVALDASDGGYGAVVPSRPGDWVSVGALVGLRAEDDPAGRMGVVRQITADAVGQLRVGLNFIGEVAIPVTLFPVSMKNINIASSPGEPAVIVSFRPERHGEIELLLGPGSFLRARALLMRFRDRIHRIERLEPVAPGPGYNHLSCRLVLSGG